MPRPRNAIPKVRWYCYVPEDLSSTIDLLLMNPLTGRAAYSARSDLVEELLRKWLAEQRKENQQGVIHR